MSNVLMQISTGLLTLAAVGWFFWVMIILFVDYGPVVILLFFSVIGNLILAVLVLLDIGRTWKPFAFAILCIVAAVLFMFLGSGVQYLENPNSYQLQNPPSQTATAEGINATALIKATITADRYDTIACSYEYPAGSGNTYQGIVGQMTTFQLTDTKTLVLDCRNMSHVDIHVASK